jgi:transcriptional antiterminator RfaH
LYIRDRLEAADIVRSAFHYSANLLVLQITAFWVRAIPRWTLAHIALRNLIRQDFTVFNPTFEVKKLFRRKLTVVREALFPGYLFVELLPDAHWSPINSTHGVTRLLTYQPADSEYLVPCSIPEALVCGLRGCCNYLVEDAKPVWRLASGTKVKILSGPFAGFGGEIASWSGADRCRLIVWLLNRETTVTVRDADITAVE